jgi:hypothetical protein
LKIEWNGGMNSHPAHGIKNLMIDRRALLLSAAALLAGGAARAAEAGDPLAIVGMIYKRAIKEDGGGFLTLEHAERKKYMSKSFTALWKKAEENTPKGDVLIDADPVSNSQDPDIASFTVKQELRQADRATVAATFKERSQDRGRQSALDLTVRYNFVREGGRWMIDDIRGTVDGKPWSIRQNLEYSLRF